MVVPAMPEVSKSSKGDMSAFARAEFFDALVESVEEIFYARNLRRRVREGAEE